MPLRRFLFPFFIFVVLMGTRITTIHNAYDALPFARASVSGWLNGDWYLSQTIPYRILFNALAGSLYALTNFWTAFFSLKVIQFGLFAWVFSKLLPRLGLGVSSTLLFLFFFSSNQSLVAMEWMYGDSDSKVFAYLCFFLALERFFEEDDNWASFLMGLAASFHVLVGGYLSILYFGIMVILRKKISLKMAGTYAAGALLAFYAIFVELTQKGDASADLIYVLLRVPHHVVPDWKLSGWVFEYMIYNSLFLYIYRRTSSKNLKSFLLFPLLSNVFWILGMVIYLLGDYSLLKYYFFRVPDTLLPFSAFLLVALGIESYLRKHGKMARLLTASMLAIGVVFFIKKTITFETTEENQDVYSWIKEFTPKDAVFLTDPTDSTFYIYAERPMVASYKHSPQIKKYFLEWLERLEFMTDAVIDRSRPLERKVLSREYDLRNPEHHLDDYKNFHVSYVMSKIPITSKFFTLVFQGKHVAVYRVNVP